MPYNYELDEKIKKSTTPYEYYCDRMSTHISLSILYPLIVLIPCTLIVLYAYIEGVENRDLMFVLLYGSYVFFLLFMSLRWLIIRIKYPYKQGAYIDPEIKRLKSHNDSGSWSVEYMSLIGVIAVIYIGAVGLLYLCLIPLNHYFAPRGIELQYSEYRYCANRVSTYDTPDLPLPHIDLGLLHETSADCSERLIKLRACYLWKGEVDGIYRYVVNGIGGNMECSAMPFIRAGEVNVGGGHEGKESGYVPHKYRSLGKGDLSKWGTGGIPGM